MRFNTGNPVEPDGSSDPRDLYDTAGIADLLINGPLGEYLSRLGVPLKSWRGIMQQVTDYLVAQGYESIYLTYGADVIVERQTQLVQRDGELYRLMNASDIPLTLTGTWTTDAPKLQAVGDSALRQILTSSAGAAFVKRGASNVDEDLTYIETSISEIVPVIGDLASRKHAYSTPLLNIDNSAASGVAYKDGPRLVETSTGKVMAFYRVGNSHVENTGYLAYKVFDPVAKQWGAPIVLDDDAQYDTRNQMAGCDPNTGRVFCFYAVWNAPDAEVYRKSFYKYSDDDGVTWSARQDFGQYCPYPFLDNIPFGKLTSFANGKLLISIYNYLTIFTLSSTDGGLTWGTTSASLPNPNPNIVTVVTGMAASGNDNITEPTIVKINEAFLVAVCRCFPTGTEPNGTTTVQYLGTSWASGTRYLSAEYCYNAGRLYYASAGGTSGGTAPTHTSGSATDGTVTWTVAGTPTTWAINTAYVINQLLLVGGARVYKVTVAGTSGPINPAQTKILGNETQIAYFKSQDAGLTWTAPSKVTWTPNLKNVSMSPPCVVMADQDTVEVAWFARYPDFNLYRVRMAARAFFGNPSWAFSDTDGEPRNRIWRGLAAPTNDKQYDIDFGYVDLLPLSWATGTLAAWYDTPLLSHSRADGYSTVINV